MPLIDCLTLASDIVDEKAKSRILDRQATLMKEGMSEKKAGQTVINEFAHEYGGKLNGELNKIKKSMKLPSGEHRISTKGNVEEITKRHSEELGEKQEPSDRKSVV